MDADTIMRRLHELEEENKRLRSLLAEHGIPFEACVHDGNLAVPQYSKLTSSSVSLSLQEKVDCSRAYSKVVRMCLLKDGIVKRLRSLAISLYVNVNGTGSSASSGNTNVPNALTGSSHLYHTNTFLTTLPVKTTMGVM